MLERGEPEVSLPPIVLLIDDESTRREAYETELSAAGLWVSGCDASDEAISWALELNPDVIVTRMQIPVDDDQESFVRRVHALCSAPLLVVSGKTRSSSDSASEKLPADAWITEPVTPRTLRAEIIEVLARGRRARERSDAVLERVPDVLSRASRALEKSGDVRVRAKERRVDGRVRPCPRCGTPLPWHSHREVAGLAYDYYPPCPKGCGLFCYNVGRKEFERLA